MTLTVLNDKHIGANRTGGTTPQTAWQLRQDILAGVKDLLEQVDGDLMLLGDFFDSGSIPRADFTEAFGMLYRWLARGTGHLWLVAGNHDLNKDSRQLSDCDRRGFTCDCNCCRSLRECYRRRSSCECGRIGQRCRCRFGAALGLILGHGHWRRRRSAVCRRISACRAQHRFSQRERTRDTMRVDTLWRRLRQARSHWLKVYHRGTGPVISDRRRDTLLRWRRRRVRKLQRSWRCGWRSAARNYRTQPGLQHCRIYQQCPGQCERPDALARHFLAHDRQ